MEFDNTNKLGKILKNYGMNTINISTLIVTRADFKKIYFNMILQDDFTRLEKKILANLEGLLTKYCLR